MRAAVIGASSESIYAIKKAKELGLDVIALDGNKDAPGLKEADSSFVVDIRDSKKVEDILKDNKPDVVLPVPIGRYLTTTGKINDKFGLCGVSYDAANKCTDKYEFHKLLHEKGLRNVELYLIPAGSDDTLADELNEIYPVVVKPRCGSGSRGVEIFNTRKELQEKFLKGEPYDEDYIVESCVSGPEYGVDGVFVVGDFILILLRGKKNTPAPYRECVGYYSVIETDKNKEFFTKVKNLMNEVGKVIGFVNNIVHADIIRDSSDNPFIIETSARPSGHNLHNLFTPMASGVDEVTEFIKMAVPELKMPYSFKPSVHKNTLIKYFDFENVRINNVPDEKLLFEKYPLKAYCCNLKKGMYLGKVTNGASIMGRGFFILEASTTFELDGYSDAILNEFEVEETK